MWEKILFFHTLLTLKRKCDEASTWSVYPYFREPHHVIFFVFNYYRYWKMVAFTYPPTLWQSWTPSLLSAVQFIWNLIAVSKAHSARLPNTLWSAKLLHGKFLQPVEVGVWSFTARSGCVFKAISYLLDSPLTLKGFDAEIEWRRQYLSSNTNKLHTGPFLAVADFSLLPVPNKTCIAQ